MPEVSIIIPVRENDPGLLLKKLDYLHDGSFSNFEIIIVDDNSPISISEFIDRDRYHLISNCIRLDNPAPYNMPVAKNIGAKHAKSDWISMSDVDVWYSSREIEKLLLYRDMNPEGDIFVGKLFLLEKGNYELHCTWQDRICCLAIMKKSLFWKVGGCEERMVGHYGFDDDLLRYKLKKVGKYMIVDDALAYMDRWDKGSIPGGCGLNKDIDINWKKFVMFTREFDSSFQSNKEDKYGKE